MAPGQWQCFIPWRCLNFLVCRSVHFGSQPHSVYLSLASLRKSLVILSTLSCWSLISFKKSWWTSSAIFLTACFMSLASWCIALLFGLSSLQFYKWHPVSLAHLLFKVWRTSWWISMALSCPTPSPWRHLTKASESHWVPGSTHLVKAPMNLAACFVVPTWPAAISLTIFFGGLVEMFGNLSSFLLVSFVREPIVPFLLVLTKLLPVDGDWDLSVVWVRFLKINSEVFLNFMDYVILLAFVMLFLEWIPLCLKSCQFIPGSLWTFVAALFS